ncbi:MAG: outer membrane lipoprotein carrier protein LolA [Deltaproteobacteria bacterium]|nr:outer membrane lipoprotein carrier protein LolA [Nannocystaceae bacterium]
MDVVTCMLSYGLMCSAAEKPAEAPPVPSVSDFDPADTTPAAPKGAASKVLASVQKFYDGTTDFEGAFEQTYVDPVYGTKKKHAGKLRVKKPGKMVWDYTEGDNPDFWVDGKRVHVVEHDTKQVLRKDVDASDFAGAEKFLFGGSQLVTDFKVRTAGEKLIKTYGKPGHSLIELAPKKTNPHYQYLLLVVDDATGRVDAFVVLNADGSTNQFELTGVVRNGGLADAKFEFVKPKGFTEIEG